MRSVLQALNEPAEMEAPPVKAPKSRSRSPQSASLAATSSVARAHTQVCRMPRRAGQGEHRALWHERSAEWSRDPSRGERVVGEFDPFKSERAQQQHILY